MRGCGTIFLIAYLAFLGLAVVVYGPIIILYAVVGFCSGYLGHSSRGESRDSLPH